MRELYLLEGEPEDAGWQERGLCAQTDPEAFFPEKGGSTREAKKVCLTCDVRQDCLEYALENDERFGIWGGLSERERRKLKKQAVERAASGPVSGPDSGLVVRVHVLGGHSEVVRQLFHHDGEQQCLEVGTALGPVLERPAEEHQPWWGRLRRRHQ